MTAKDLAGCEVVLALGGLLLEESESCTVTQLITLARWLVPELRETIGGVVKIQHFSHLCEGSNTTKKKKGKRSLGSGELPVIVVFRVAVDGDDADGGAGRVRDDDGLRLGSWSRSVVDRGGGRRHRPAGGMRSLRHFLIAKAKSIGTF